MILIKKTGTCSINIYLDENDANELNIFLEEKTQDLLISNQSHGFDGKSLAFLRILYSGGEEVSQSNKTLILDIDEDDLEYFKFKLSQFLLEDEFIPEELFSLTYSKNKNTINFFLTKKN